MLRSPGFSPRQISLPSTVSENGSSEFIAPQSKVLDEDAYVEAIERIVERDYFPDISKLRDRLDWLEAIRSGDPILIRDAQLKIMERRGRKVRRLNPSDGKYSQTPFMRSLTTTPFDEFEVKTPKTSKVVDDESLSLDEFFRRYTSEDNFSFSKILEKDNRKRKERYAYLTEGEREGEKSIEDLKRIRITDGYGTSDQPPSTLEGWNYTAKNLLMYHPADRGEAPLTEEERAVRLNGLTKEINRASTRFYTPVAGATPHPVSDRDGDRLKKYDLEDLKKTPNPFYVESGKKAENGFSFVRTPSPAPGVVDESPFITWGEIEGTPLRLDPEEETRPIDIGGSVDGPRYNIPCPPARDEKAHSLSRDAARKLREKSLRMTFQKPPLILSSPSVRGGSMMSPSIRRTLSPAAQKYVRKAIAKSSSSFDETLRASYSPSCATIPIPKRGRSLSRFARDGSFGSCSPSVKQGCSSNLAW